MNYDARSIVYRTAVQTVVVCIINDCQNVMIARGFNYDICVSIVVAGSGGLLSNGYLIHGRTAYAFLLVIVNSQEYNVLIHVEVGSSQCSVSLIELSALNCYIALRLLIHTSDCNLVYSYVGSIVLNVDELVAIIGVDQQIASLQELAIVAIILQGNVLRTIPYFVYGYIVVILALSALVSIRGHVSILVVRASAGVGSISSYNCNANGFQTIGLLGSVLNRSAICILPVVNSLTGQDLNLILSRRTIYLAVSNEYNCTVVECSVVNLLLVVDGRSSVDGLVASLVASTQCTQRVVAVAAGRVGVQLVQVRTGDGVARLNVSSFLRRIVGELLNSDGLGGAIHEVSLNLGGGSRTGETSVGGVVVSQHQNVSRSRLGLLSVYNVVANGNEIVGAAGLNRSSVVCNGRTGSDLEPGVVNLNFNRLRRLDGVNLSRSGIQLGYNIVARSSQLLINNSYVIVLSIAGVDVQIADVLRTNAIVDGDGLGTNIGDLAYNSRDVNNNVSLVIAVGIDQLNGTSNLINVGIAFQIGQSNSRRNVRLNSLNLGLIVVQLVLGVLQLGLLVLTRNRLQLANSTGSNDLGVIISVYAVNVNITVGFNLLQNLNIQADQVGNIGRNLIIRIAANSDLIGILTRGGRYRSPRNTF